MIFEMTSACMGILVGPIEPAYCPDADSGYVHLQVYGGTPPFSFLWSNGSTANDLEGATPGVHQVLISDNATCTIEVYVYVPGPVAGAAVDLSPFMDALPYFRPGLPTNFYAGVMELGCADTSGELQVILDPLVSLVSGLEGDDWQSGDTLVLVFDEITYAMGMERDLEVYTDATAEIGDSVCFHLSVNSFATDIIPENNLLQFCYPIVNSYDPNDKQVFPAGSGPQGFIPADTRLTYMIRFQNTGNAPAFNVFIDDTLDMDLDIMDLQVHGSSHPMYLEILDDRVLRFRFDDINLPDSLSDEANSHGYVVYSIPLMPGSTGGTTIENTAYIYFDLNPPVITNTTLNTINLNTDLAELVHDHLLRAWPNPVDEQLHVSIPGALQGAEMRIIDTQGRLIHRSVATADRLVVDTGSWAAGVYAITVGNIAVRVVK